jgi:hypothetical protein
MRLRRSDRSRASISSVFKLQRVVLGPVSMEYADLFVAVVLGAVLAADSRNRGLASLLGAGAATSLGAFFLVTNVLLATCRRPSRSDWRSSARMAGSAR